MGRNPIADLAVAEDQSPTIIKFCGQRKEPSLRCQRFSISLPGLAMAMPAVPDVTLIREFLPAYDSMYHGVSILICFSKHASKKVDPYVKRPCRIGLDQYRSPQETKRRLNLLLNHEEKGAEGKY